LRQRAAGSTDRTRWFALALIIAGFSGPALTHGFQIAFYVLAGLAAAGALISVVMLESRPTQPELPLTSEAFSAAD
jgi:hypothetical protein